MQIRAVDEEVRFALALPDEAFGGVDGALGLRWAGQLRPVEELQWDRAAVAECVEAGQGLAAAAQGGEPDRSPAPADESYAPGAAAAAGTPRIPCPSM